MTIRLLPKALLLVVALVVSGCAGGGRTDDTTITVYSASGLGSWYAKRFEQFTKDTGVRVRLFEAGSGEVVSRVNSPAVWNRIGDAEPPPPADLIVTLPPFIQRADKAGLLQASGVDVQGIPAEAVGPGGTFVPIVNTALCFIANPAAQPPLQTWNDLLRPDLKGKLQYSTPGEAGDGTAVLLLLQKLMGKQGALDYLAKLQANNVGPSSSTAALQQKVSSGELLVANGDVQMNLASINTAGAKFSVFFPAASDGSRTTVSLSYFAGVTASAPRPEEAKRLLGFLLSDEVQKTVYTEAFGIPVRSSVAEGGNAGPGTPTDVLKGVTLWRPDWHQVLADLETDIAAYRKAVG